MGWTGLSEFLKSIQFYMNESLSPSNRPTKVRWNLSLVHRALFTLCCTMGIRKQHIRLGFGLVIQIFTTNIKSHTQLCRKSQNTQMILVSFCNWSLFQQYIIWDSIIIMKIKSKILTWLMFKRMGTALSKEPVIQNTTLYKLYQNDW